MDNQYDGRSGSWTTNTLDRYERKQTKPAPLYMYPMSAEQTSNATEIESASFPDFPVRKDQSSYATQRPSASFQDFPVRKDQSSYATQRASASFQDFLVRKDQSSYATQRESASFEDFPVRKDPSSYATQLQSASVPDFPVKKNPSSSHIKNQPMLLKRKPSWESKNIATYSIYQPYILNVQQEQSLRPRHSSMPIQPSIRSQSMPVQTKRSAVSMQNQPSSRVPVSRQSSNESYIPKQIIPQENASSGRISSDGQRISGNLYINDKTAAVNPRMTHAQKSFSSTLPRAQKAIMQEQTLNRSKEYEEYEPTFKHTMASEYTSSLPASTIQPAKSWSQHTSSLPVTVSIQRHDILEGSTRYPTDTFTVHRTSPTTEPAFVVHGSTSQGDTLSSSDRTTILAPPPLSVHRSTTLSEPSFENLRSTSLPDPPFAVHRPVNDLCSTRAEHRHIAKSMTAPKSPRIPDEILRMDNKSVELYLRILETGIETKHDIRVIVVGKQGAGKTCLIRRLLNENVNNVQSTNGIEIHVKKCKVRLRDGQWIMEKGNIRRHRNVRLLSSVLHHIRKSSSSDVTALAHNLPETETCTITTQNDMLFKEEAQEQNATANGTLDSAFKDLRDVVDAENELDDEEYATLALWDFAGDKEFYNTHQTFLSHDAIYLVVTNLCDKNETEAMNILKFWFDSIHCYGAGRDYVDDLLDPPVLAIGTHKDVFRGDCTARLREQVQSVMHDSRRHLRSCFTISNINDTDDVFDNVKHAIFNTVRGKANWGKEMPLKFIQLEKSLHEKQNEGHVILSFSNIANLATKVLKPIRFTEEIDLFLRYQHEIGNLVYFSDIPEYIILDPQWLANAFSSIVTAEKFQMELLGYDEWDDFQRTGMLKTRLLNALFSKQPKNIQNHQDHIVKVMEKFDILIRPKTATGDNRNKEERHYFVPCMIKKNVLSNIDELCKVQNNNKTSCLCFVFNFLPHAFINHLIVSCIRRFTTSRVRNHVNNKKQPALFEGLGVFDISDTGCEKLLVAVFDNTVQIQVWKYGNVPYRVYSDVQTYIRDEIHRIQCGKYRMINISYQLKFKCALTRYNNLEGLRNKLQHGQSYCCEEHDEVHEFQDDWFEGQSKKDDATMSTEEKSHIEKTARRLFERIENHKSHNRNVKQADYIQKESSTGHQTETPAYKVRIQRNYKNIVSSIKHDTIVDHLIQEDVFSLDDSEIIDACPAQTHKNRKLIQILLKRGERGYREFINALRFDPVYVELADIIENTIVIQ